MAKDINVAWAAGLFEGEGTTFLTKPRMRGQTAYSRQRRQERAAEVMEHAATLVEHRGFCKRGHDLSDPQHLYVHKKTGKRHCRTCRIEGSRRRRVPRLAT